MQFTPATSSGIEHRRDLFRRVKSAVVAIVRTRLAPFAGMAGRSVQETLEPLDFLGTGAIVDDRGVVMTADHLVRDWFDEAPADTTGQESRARLHVLIHSEAGIEGGRFQYSLTTVPVVAIASDEGLDVAALLLDPKRSGPTTLPVVEASQSPCEEGDEIATCGYPLGRVLHKDLYESAVINPSFSAGIVSAVFPYPGAPQDIRRVFQIDAMINRGNSGGPVFDVHSGRMVGVISNATYRQVEALVLQPSPKSGRGSHGDFAVDARDIDIPIGLARVAELHAAAPLIQVALEQLPKVI